MEWLAEVPLHWILAAVAVLAGILIFLRRFPGRHTPGAQAWAENVSVLLWTVVAVFLVIRPFIFQTFYIPSGSMEPTLLGPAGTPGARMSQGAGDRLIADKLIYRVGDPQRFDIAVFKAPRAASVDEKDYIKRVIGLPGETVEVLPTRILLDGRPVLLMDDVWTPLPMPVPAEPFPADGKEFVYHDDPVKVLVRESARVEMQGERVLIDGKVALETEGSTISRERGLAGLGGDAAVEAQVFWSDALPRLILLEGREAVVDPGHTLVNGKRLPEPYIKEAPSYTMEPIKLGKGEYLMLGDNRNESADGHVWGALARDRFIGRAEIVFWPANRFRILHWWLIIALGIFYALWRMIHGLRANRRPQAPPPAETVPVSASG